MTVKSLSRFALIAALALVASGCASSIHLSRADLASIHTVSVQKEPGAVETVYYLPIGKLVGSSFGLTGALIAQAAGQGNQDKLAEAMTDPSANPARIVGEEFEARLRNAPFLPKFADIGDATFAFRVKQAGVGVRHGFTAKMAAGLVVEAQLIRRDGKILWQQTETARGTCKPGGNEFPDYLKDHSVLAADFRAAAADLVTKWAADIKNDLGVSTRPDQH